MNQMRRAAFTTSIIDCVMLIGFLYGMFCLMSINFGVEPSTASTICIVVFVVLGVGYSWVNMITLRRMEFTMRMIDQEIEKQKKRQQINPIQKKE